MTESPSNNRNEASQPSFLRTLHENIEDALAVEIHRQALQSRSEGRQRSHSRFSNIGDLPGFLRHTVGSIFRSTLQRYQRANHADSEGHIPRIADGIEEPTEIAVEETWSEYLQQQGQSEKSFEKISPLNLSNVGTDTYCWTGSAIVLNNPSTQSLLGEDDAAFLEKQVITTELDAFITSLQQDRKDKYFDKFDADDSKSEKIRRDTQIRAGLALFFLLVIVIGNIGGGFFFLFKHFN